MELYTLTDQFLPNKIVDGYTSAIWTERYFTYGDTQIVVPTFSDLPELLKDGTFLALRGSDEVMILESQGSEKGSTTIVGKTLDFFLNERMAWFRNPEYPDEGANSVSDRIETTSAGQLIANTVEKSVIIPESQFDGGTADLDYVRDTIANLELGDIDTNGVDDRALKFPTGPLYDGAQRIATDHGLGFRLFLYSADEDGYVLKFSVYRGRDKTSGQDVNPLVRLSPQRDSLSDIKEILSIAEYKNVVYVHYKNVISTHYAEPTLDIPEGFDRRTFVREAEGDSNFPDADTEESVLAYRAQHAADAFANNNYIRAIDGQTSGPTDYIFGKHYKLGDIIELEGVTGLLAKARVTEYIRSEDQLGDREYPTISVVDPLDSGNMPTLDPTPDPGFSDPDLDPYPDVDPEAEEEPDLGIPDEADFSTYVDPDPSPYPPEDVEDPDPDPDPPVSPPGAPDPPWLSTWLEGDGLPFNARWIQTMGDPDLHTVENIFTPTVSHFPEDAYDIQVYVRMELVIRLTAPAVSSADFDDLTGTPLIVALGDFDYTSDIEDVDAEREYFWYTYVNGARTDYLPGTSDHDLYIPYADAHPGVDEVVMVWTLTKYFDAPAFEDLGLDRLVLGGPNPNPGSLELDYASGGITEGNTSGLIEMGLRFRSNI